MEGWFEFALERYNYWIVIILMMTGLYIVIARGNLVKKVVGLNLFQTSVFIFYITIGKISGGTAPIFIKGDGYDDKSHGGGYGEESAVSEAPVSEGHGEAVHGAEAESLHGKVDNVKVDNVLANDLKAATDALGPTTETADAPSLHQAPEGQASGELSTDKISNDALAAIEKPAEGFDVAGDAAVDLSHGAGDALSGALPVIDEVIYSNPLPHVLILTAIVVGVATTAVGLALAVRIREAYGTIEEDELHALDNVAEFGAEAASASNGGEA